MRVLHTTTVTEQKVLNQGMRRLFFEAIHALVRLEFLTTDSFVIAKAKIFSSEVINILADYEARKRGIKNSESDVAQYNHHDGARLERVLLGLEYIQHFGAIPSAPLLVALRSVLKIRSELFFAVKTNFSDAAPLESEREIEIPKKRIETDNKKIHILLSENKKKILEFISQSVSVRPKDVLHQFSHLTKRTVKRNLQELFQAGLLKKENKDKAVLYTVSKK